MTTENTTTETNGIGPDEGAGPAIDVDEVTRKLEAAANEALAAMLPPGVDASVHAISLRDLMNSAADTPHETPCGCVSFTVERDAPLPVGHARISVTAHWHPDTDLRMLASELSLAHAEAMSKVAYLGMAMDADDEDDVPFEPVPDGVDPGEGAENDEAPAAGGDGADGDR